jgi:hypothetical protein
MYEYGNVRLSPAQGKFVVYLLGVAESVGNNIRQEIALTNRHKIKDCLIGSFASLRIHLAFGFAST